jgi:hypothetical protein
VFSSLDDRLYSRLQNCPRIRPTHYDLTELVSTSRIEHAGDSDQTHSGRTKWS